MDPHGILTEENKEILVSNHGFNIFDLELKLAIVNSSETKKLLLRITVTFWHLLATSCGPRPTAWPVDSSWLASSATIGWPKWDTKWGIPCQTLTPYQSFKIYKGFLPYAGPWLRSRVFDGIPKKKYLCYHWFGMQHFHLRPLSSPIKPSAILYPFCGSLPGPMGLKPHCQTRDYWLNMQ